MEIKSALIDWLSSKWPADGWIVVVSLDNKEGCADYNGLGDTDKNKNQCFDNWYAGCREKSMAYCRNEIAISQKDYQASNNERRKRIAIAVQINKKIEHMRNVDTKHIMWWASHADGCESVDLLTDTEACQKCDQTDSACRKVNDFIVSLTQARVVPSNITHFASILNNF